MSLNLKKNFILFVKAQGSAIVGTLVDFTFAIVLTKICLLFYLYANMIGAMCGGITNCIINYKYVFEDAHQRKCHIAVKYFIVWLGSNLLNSYGTFALTELSRVYFLYPKIIVSVIVAVFWNYQLQKYFVYKNCHMEKIFKCFKR